MVESISRSSHKGPDRTTGRLVVGLVIALAVIGAALRIWQYAANTSLWLDELALAKGIVDSDLSQLLFSRPPNNQVVPRGFLLMEKIAVLALGPNDYALRLFPLLFSLISLAAFGRLAIRMLEGFGSVAATLLFAVAVPFIAFGSTVKQYSADVCIAVLLWWLAYEVASRPATARRKRLTALVGAILVWFSQPGVVILVALSACLVLLALRRPGRWRDRWRDMVLIPACWVASALAATVVGFVSMSQATREYVKQFWVGGFPPRSLSRELATLWPWDQLSLLFGSGQGAQAGMAYPFPIVSAVLCAAGFVILWRRNRKAAALLIAPLILTIGGALARQYPFSDRLIAFLVPGFLLAIGTAIDGLYRACARISRLLGASIALALLALGVYPVALSPPPYRVEHVKPVLSYLQARWQQSDSLYVYYGAAPAASFYAARYGFTRADYAVGGCHRGDSRRYLQELDTFRGRSRVWVFITHSIPYYREKEDILRYLDSTGTRQDEFAVQSYAVGRYAPPAEVYLFDLSDAGRLANIAAESFPLTGPSAALPGFGCDIAAQAMIPSDFR